MEELAPIPVIEVEGPCFTIFPKLPLELRLIIWSFALPDPQVVTIKKKVESAQQEATTTFKAEASYCMITLLHVCRESRSVAQKHYRLSFKQHLMHPVYIDFSKDTVYFVNCDALEAFIGQPWYPYVPMGLNEKKYIQYLVIGGQLRNGIQQKVTRFESLRSLVLSHASVGITVFHFDPMEDIITQRFAKGWKEHKVTRNEMRKERKHLSYKKDLDLTLPRLSFYPQEVLEAFMEHISLKTLHIIHHPRVLPELAPFNAELMPRNLQE